LRRSPHDDRTRRVLNAFSADASERVAGEPFTSVGADHEQVCVLRGAEQFLCRRAFDQLGLDVHPGRLDAGGFELAVEQLPGEAALGVLLVDLRPFRLRVRTGDRIGTTPGVNDPKYGAAQLGLVGCPPQGLPRGLRPVDSANDARHYVLPRFPLPVARHVRQGVRPARYRRMSDASRRDSVFDSPLATRSSRVGAAALWLRSLAGAPTLRWDPGTALSDR